MRALAKSVWVERPTPIRGLWLPPAGAKTKVWVSPRMRPHRPSLQAVLPFGVVLVLGNSADAYGWMEHAFPSLGPLRAARVFRVRTSNFAFVLHYFFPVWDIISQSEFVIFK